MSNSEFKFKVCYMYTGVDMWYLHMLAMAGPDLSSNYMYELCRVVYVVDLPLLCSPLERETALRSGDDPLPARRRLSGTLSVAQSTTENRTCRSTCVCRYALLS